MAVERTQERGASALATALEQVRALPGFVRARRVVVAMSGGIDSSVAAALLHRAGLEVVGLSMRLFQPGPSETSGTSEGNCCSLDDFHDARRVAQELGFAHYIVDLSERFRREVMAPFVHAYLDGLTPSPCINCNRFLKFDELLERSEGLGADHVATGHYARILADSDGAYLAAATDPVKDQSYFLYHLNQLRMNRIFFPLGGWTKAEVRSLARELGLHLAEKVESQEICFIPEGRYDRFLTEAGAVEADRPGEIRHRDGRLLGQHLGYWKFTVGQRKGIGVAAPNPLYVLRIDPAANRVWVGEEEDLGRDRLTAMDVNWCGPVPPGPLRCRVKIRSRSASAPAQVVPLPGARAEVRFDVPQRAVAPGQAAVFYQGEKVLGGGWIEAERP